MSSPPDRRGPCGTSATSGTGREARRRLAGDACDCSRPVSHPVPTQRGVVRCVCPHSRIAAVSLAEFVAVHIVLVKLPVAILTHPQFRVKYYYSQSSFRTPPVPSVFEDNPVYRRRRRRRRPTSQPASRERALPSLPALRVQIPPGGVGARAPGGRRDTRSQGSGVSVSPGADDGSAQS